MKIAIRARQRHAEISATLLNPQALGCRNVRLDLMRGRAFFLAILERSQPAPVQRRVRIRGVCDEALPQHEHRFAMLVYTFANKRNVRSQRHIAGNFLPNELELVRRRPHILPAAGDRIVPFGCVVLDGPCV